MKILVPSASESREQVLMAGKGAIRAKQLHQIMATRFCLKRLKVCQAIPLRKKIQVVRNRKAKTDRNNQLLQLRSKKPRQESVAVFQLPE